MKIAIIGTGISGNVAAYLLHKHHDISVFEANHYSGGHSNTHTIVQGGKSYAIDTGFIVFNNKTYPNFVRLLQELGVKVQPTTMGFSVKCEKSGLEYNGNTLNSMFAQRSNLLRPSFYRMIMDILRFNKSAISALDNDEANLSLGEFLSKGGYGFEFINQYLIPMGAAIWSTHPDQMLQFPAGFFIRFFHNHGLLSVNDRPLWHVISGGSQEYVKKLTAPFADRIRHNCAVKSVTRHSNHVLIELQDGRRESFDQVFIATHSDQALRMLNDASHAERDVLSAIPYQENEAVLHTDASVLPARKLAWSAWNYHILPGAHDRVALTYNMNILQGIESEQPFCVTLNNSNAIADDKIIKKVTYHHPVFTPAGIQAQQRHAEINGVNRTYFCGAYWRYGFHEDGVISALDAIKHFEEVNHAQLLLRRAS